MLVMHCSTTKHLSIYRILILKISKELKVYLINMTITFIITLTFIFYIFIKHLYLYFSVITYNYIDIYHYINIYIFNIFLRITITCIQSFK